MHHCSFLCSVSWLLMSGYLRYPRENPSFSLFRELSNLSFREETGVSEAFDIVSSCPMDSGIFMSEDTWCKQDLNIHYIPQLDMSVGLCIKKFTVFPPPTLIWVTPIWDHVCCRIWWYTSRNCETSINIDRTTQRVSYSVFVLCESEILQCEVDAGGRWWALSLLCGQLVVFFYQKLLFHCHLSAYDIMWLSALMQTGKTKHTGKSRHLITSVCFPFFA